MDKKHTINYKSMFAVLALTTVFGVFFTIWVWSVSAVLGALVMALSTGIVIYEANKSRTQSIIAVSVANERVVIEYRDKKVSVNFDDCKQIEHYKHGPLTERILLRTAQDIIEIPNYLTDFNGMCAAIYEGLISKGMEHVADEWFRSRFAHGADVPINRDEDAGERFTANFPLIWTLMAVQFLLATGLAAVLLWSDTELAFKIIVTGAFVFVEFLAVQAVTSPRLTQSVTVSAERIAMHFKEKRFDIPIGSCKGVAYVKPCPMPHRVYIYADNGYVVLLPWYIRNFHGMSRSIYRVLADGDMESIANARFRRKFGKVNKRKHKSM